MDGRLVRIDCDRITDDGSLHDTFSDAFGFPGFYGRNMDAWIDCMTRLDEDMSDVRIDQGQVVTLQLDNYRNFKQRCPELLDQIIECGAVVNWRRLEVGARAILVMSFYG